MKGLCVVEELKVWAPESESLGFHPSLTNHLLCVSLGKPLIVAHHPVCKMMTVRAVVRVHQITYIKCLKQCLAHNKYSEKMNSSY